MRTETLLDKGLLFANHILLQLRFVLICLIVLSAKSRKPMLSDGDDCINIMNSCVLLPAPHLSQFCDKRQVRCEEGGVR